MDRPAQAPHAWGSRGGSTRRALAASSADAFDSIGNGGPTVWVDGVVVGAWAQRPDGEIRVHWFQDVPAGRRAQVADRARELEGWLGETRFTARFPGAITASLLA